MGGLKDLPGPVYLDTNIFIYALEGYSKFKSCLTALFTALDQHNIEAVTSELTIAEVLAKPFREKQIDQQATYQRMLQTTPAFQVIPISRNILVTAAQLRGSCNIKLPDAIHVATAQQMSCRSFLTNDTLFKTINNLSVILLSEWQP